jgi:hypothetical protein
MMIIRITVFTLISSIIIASSTTLALRRDLSKCDCSIISCAYKYGNGEGSNYIPKEGYTKCYKECCETSKDYYGRKYMYFDYIALLE